MAQRSHQLVPLGEQLYFWRTHAKWSRRKLAEAAGIAISTVQDLEHGHGSLTYYLLTLDALDLHLATPGHGHRRLGTAFHRERISQGIARRDLARHLKVSRTTLASLEDNKSVRIATIDAYARSLRIALIVRPRARN